MGMYDILKKVTNGALLVLFIAIVLAVLDHFLFEEVYRSTISVIGIIALCVFFIGIILAVVKGATDKDKTNT